MAGYRAVKNQYVKKSVEKRQIAKGILDHSTVSPKKGKLSNGIFKLFRRFDYTNTYNANDPKSICQIKLRFSTVFTIFGF